MFLVDLLLTFADVSITMIDIFDGHGTYRKGIRKYQKWRHDYLIDSAEIAKLKYNQMIAEKNGVHYLTTKGKERILRERLHKQTISVPISWDKKWRVILFDIPESRRNDRNNFRRELNRLGLTQIQKSVYCYPHDCIKEVMFVTNYYRLKKYVTIAEVSSIITGKNIFEDFSKRNII
jgi:CRISPR/Cas system-associated endoribonuclease Cas2